MPVKELRLNLRPLIKKFEILAKKNTIGDLTGSYVTAIKGRGLEFEGFRPYSINDDASQIDWKASLRAQETLVKKFVEERNLNAFFIFQVSNSMLFASTDKLKAEYGAELIASLAFSILQAGDYVGLAMFNDRMVKVIPLMMGTRHYYIIIRQLSDPNLYGGPADLGYALKFLMDYLRSQSLVILVSDFMGLKSDWDSYLSAASRKFDLVPIMIRDPHDFTMPAGVGQVVIRDPYSDEQMVIDTAAVKQQFEQNAKQQVELVRQAFKKREISLLELQTDQPFVAPIINFFRQHGAR